MPRRDSPNQDHKGWPSADIQMYTGCAWSIKVFLQPLTNDKTAEPTKPNFYVVDYSSPAKVYSWSKLKNVALKYLLTLTIFENIHQFLKKSGKVLFCKKKWRRKKQQLKATIVGRKGARSLNIYFRKKLYFFSAKFITWSC